MHIFLEVNKNNHLCPYISTLYFLASGFYLIEMTENYTQKTAFSTENGDYKFLPISFGLENTAATFESVMNKILCRKQNESNISW